MLILSIIAIAISIACYSQTNYSQEVPSSIASKSAEASVLLQSLDAIDSILAIMSEEDLAKAEKIVSSISSYNSVALSSYFMKDTNLRVVLNTPETQNSCSISSFFTNGKTASAEAIKLMKRYFGQSFSVIKVYHTNWKNLKDYNKGNSASAIQISLLGSNGVAGDLYIFTDVQYKINLLVISVNEL
jgi:hypothetical protein